MDQLDKSIKEEFIKELKSLLDKWNATIEIGEEVRHCEWTMPYFEVYIGREGSLSDLNFELDRFYFC